MWSQQYWSSHAEEKPEIGRASSNIDYHAKRLRRRQQWRISFRFTAILFITLALGVTSIHFLRSEQPHQLRPITPITPITPPKTQSSPWPFPFVAVEEGIHSPTDTNSPADVENDPEDDRMAPEDCPARREWRTLQPSERKEYIAAVECTRHLFSILHGDQTGYTAFDDFPLLHARKGRSTEKTATFLPWYRRFLLLYGRALKEQCLYDGALVYWDWTLDHKALEQSPVFDSESGFGGDGDVHGKPSPVRNGRCVVDGPFANLLVPMSDTQTDLHCLSRGFRGRDGNPGHMDGSGLSPHAIAQVLSSKTYEDFVLNLHQNVIDIVPHGIAGDFESSTAPYDPIFFLHYAQLDRIWWLWQQQQPSHGLLSYGGTNGTGMPATLDDELEYDGLGRTVTVGSVMDTLSRDLCYRY